MSCSVGKKHRLILLSIGPRQQQCGRDLHGSVSLGFWHLLGGFWGWPVAQMLLFFHDTCCSALRRPKCDTKSTSSVLIQAQQWPHSLHTLLPLPQVTALNTNITDEPLLQATQVILFWFVLPAGTCLCALGLMVWPMFTLCCRVTRCYLSGSQSPMCSRCSGLQPDRWFLLQPPHKVELANSIYGWFKSVVPNLFFSFNSLYLKPIVCLVWWSDSFYKMEDFLRTDFWILNI